MFGRQSNRNRARTGNDPGRPQYYSVVCPDGHRLRGLRTEGYQAVRCPTCGAGMFVLPSSPLPDPPAAPEGAARRTAKVGASVKRAAPALDEPPIQYVEADALPEPDDHVEIVWLDQPGGPPRPLTDHDIPDEYRQSPPTDGDEERSDHSNRKPKKRAQAASPSAETAEPAPATRPQGRTRRPAETVPTVPPEGAATLVVPKPPLLARIRRHGIATAVVGATVLVSATVAYRVWRNDLDRLPQVADTNFNRGKEALSRGEFDGAKQMLATAANAFERLGGKDERTPEAQQLAREAAIYADQSSKSPKEILDDAALTPPADWPRRFEIHYQGRSVIIASSIEDLPGAGVSDGGYKLALEVYGGRGPTPARTASFDLSGFKLFESRQHAVGDPVIFGARLDALEYRDGEWKFRFQPNSGVLITDFDALKATGWTPDLTSGAQVSDGPTLEPEERRP